MSLQEITFSMTRAKLFSIFSAIFGFLGGLWISVGTILMSRKEMQELSGTYLDSNPHLPSSLTATKIDTIIGTIFIAVAFLLQIIILVSENLQFMTSRVRIKTWKSVLYLVLSSLAIALLSRHILTK